MIERYTRPEMAKLWSDENKFDTWLKVELAVCDALGSAGNIPKKDLETIKKKARYDVKRISAIEDKVHHDVIAFLTSVSEFVGESSRFIHMGMTSSDLLDTSFAILLRDAGSIIITDLCGLQKILKKRAHEFKDTPMMGRSHGIHAEPVTFGLKCALWYAEFHRHIERLEKAIEDISVGKISGAVGTYAHIEPKIEKEVLKKLKLSPDTVSTQVVSRDRHANYFAVLAGIAASIEKVAVEIRHLMRTEIGEVAEPFGKGQKGSSAMPHKRNPVLSENISGLARIVRANSMAAFENVALWHERDISHSSVERIIAPDSTTLVDFMLTRLAKLIEGLEVFPERMKKNIQLSHGLYNSQDVMLSLIDKGMTREDAYKAVQDIAMRSWSEGTSFFELLRKDERIISKISAEELKKIFDIKKHLRHIDEIFKKTFVL